MADPSIILGIDVGSVSISLAEITPKKEIGKTAYQFHHGNVSQVLRRLLTDFDLSRIRGLAVTSSTPSILKAARPYDNRVSVIAAARHFHEKIGSILVVGGEAFGLIVFDEDGHYRTFRRNTACAAGTGSFLDQQARRLALNGARELSDLACSNRGPIPKIASRCAVFAKTDLVHAQQEGYALEQICDGLCYGLAKNIADTLSMHRELHTPIIFTGGVSKNNAVVHHIESITRKPVVVDQTGMYGAMGAAFLLAEETGGQYFPHIGSVDDVLTDRVLEKKYFHQPLTLALSDYPAFGGVERYEFVAGDSVTPYPVEVDIYAVLEPSTEYSVYLGVDIGSTSTKALVLNTDGAVLAGVYTSTAGRPVAAVQRILASIDDMAARGKIGFSILGVATTGSGRKFAGKIMGADIIMDEISAHARAAVEIDPKVDTIIEIGGQDSKFTTLKSGRVTFSAMNNVCAAGTGSFIEELAQRLDCPLADYSTRSENQRSPMVSDRCTVFMERDMNHFLSEGYPVDEVLASVLHAIRENYLAKVAVEGAIGENVFFQGATAKNRALVAAFEQRLQKPIHVSKYCHLTGALGAALTLSDRRVRATTFRGLDLHKKKITVQSEVCEICTNHCKITVADVEGEKVAYGFLCGREYDAKKYINNNRSGFDLLKECKKVFSFEPAATYSQEITIGIPAAVPIFEDLPFWKKFFDELSIKTVTSEGYSDGLKEGKQIAGAEFCAPMAALHGHVKYLADRSDYIFLPFYLERKSRKRGVRRQYCYYTQFSPSILSSAFAKQYADKFLVPLVHSLHRPFRAKIELHGMLKSICRTHIGFIDVSKAYDAARDFKRSCSTTLQEIYKTESQKGRGIHVVLIGRPYTVLSRFMNKGIPDIFGSLGIRVFFQDMLTHSTQDVESMEALLNDIHWNYGAEIVKTAQTVAKARNAYPVMVTSFRCSPDSFVMDYFKKIMEAHEKPYLILQLDEHESSVGYETRIEAAIRSFENHHSSKTDEKAVRYAPSLFPTKEAHLLDKTLIIPNYDNITLQLVAANLRRGGVDARLLDESETTIQKSMRHNTGQCIPVNIIAQEFVDYVASHDLDPAKTVLWVVSSKIACNIGLYPHHIKRLIHSLGPEMDKAEVHAGPMSFIDISLRLPVNTYFAYMFGGFIRKIGCRIRPYEKEKGMTDRTVDDSIDILREAFLGKRPKEEALAEVIAGFEAIEVSPCLKPKVAIFGDLYARDNDVMNQDLIHFIESHNGEVIVTPYSSYVQMVAQAYLKKWFFEGNYLDILSSKALIATVTNLEKTYHRHFERILGNHDHEYPERPEHILSEYHVRIEHTGESVDNLLKTYYIKKHYPDVSLFVQASPAFCCPSLVTEAMAKKIEERTGVPIVSITYDGTSTNHNEAIIPYLTYLEKH